LLDGEALRPGYATVEGEKARSLAREWLTVSSGIEPDPPKGPLLPASIGVPDAPDAKQMVGMLDSIRTNLTPEKKQELAAKGVDLDHPPKGGSAGDMMSGIMGVVDSLGGMEGLMNLLPKELKSVVPKEWTEQATFMKERAARDAAEKDNPQLRGERENREQDERKELEHERKMTADCKKKHPDGGGLIHYWDKQTNTCTHTSDK